MREERSGAPDSAHRFDASRARAGASTGVPTPTRVVCHTGVNEDNPFIAIPRTREGAHARDVRSKAALAAWRVKTFGGNYDPVRAVVDEAVAAFSSRQPEVDRAIWLKVANEIGFSAFKEKADEMERIVEDCIERGNPLRNPAAAFQKRLNRYTGHGKQKGGVA